MNEEQILADIIYYALARYDQEDARLRRNRQGMAMATRGEIKLPTIKPGTKRPALARFLAAEIVRQRPEYDKEPNDE